MKSIDVVRYLNSLYYSNYSKSENNVVEEKVSKSQVKEIKNYLNNNISNFAFIEKVSGPYCKNLEKEVSLKSSQIKKIDKDIFSSMYFTWLKHNDITKEQHEKFNRAVLISVLKKGDVNHPSNYRYLYNFSNSIKLLDKIWSIEVCKELSGKLNTKNFFSYHTRGTFNESLRGLATKFTNNINNKIMLDFEKAFDNVSFYSLKKLLSSFLIRVLGNKKGKMYFERYFNIVVNSNVYYDKIKLKRNKGIPTGLPSSNLVFTMIIEQIFYIYNNINPSFKKFFNFYVYVDDIAIDVLDLNVDITSHIDKLLMVFKYYRFKYNPKKCLISENIQDRYPCFPVIEPSTKYLGVYFSRDQREYLDLIIKEFNDKKKLDLKTIDGMFKYNRKAAIGFLKYKLHPFLKK